MDIKTMRLKVEGMSCQHCVMSIKKAVGAVKGVNEVDVDLKTKQVTVNYDAAQVESEVIRTVIEDRGYDSRPALRAEKTRRFSL